MEDNRDRKGAAALREPEVAVVERVRAIGDPGVCRARRQPVLIVTDWDDALVEASMVNFVIVDGRVRFEVRLDAAREAGLKLSSRLLAVAQQVYSEAP